MELHIAYPHTTIRHMLVKTVFSHNEFGIRAGRFNFSWRRSQRTNIGPIATLITSIAITAG